MPAALPTQRPILALVTIISIFGPFGLTLFLKVEGANDKVLFLVNGALSSIGKSVEIYHFGSSEGNARKNKIFQGMKDKI